jgi:CRP-like cAMP-binding protein
MLNQIVPFRYLSRDQREGLMEDATQHAFDSGDVLIRQGDADDDRVFLLLQGSVEAFDTDRDPPVRLRTIGAGHYFGERSALFGEERSAEIRAVGSVRALSIPGDRFLRLIHESIPFAQALGNILRDKQGVFTPFDRFRTELLRSVGRGAVDLRRLLPLYRELEPALHRHAADPSTIDLDALTYAIRRLPENVTRTLAFFLTEALPPLYSEPDRRFSPVATVARRRAVYEMIPGKNMVLIRDGISDLVDLVTCLCLYAIEVRKIRRGIRDKGGLDAVTQEDLERYSVIWPEKTASRIREIALHHEDFRVEVHKELDNYNSAHAESWGQQIAEATRELLGVDPCDLPSDLPVHVISSNTHSVTNCLSPWLAENNGTVLDWAADTEHPLAKERWHDAQDLSYAVARDYLAAHPERRGEEAEAKLGAGILPLEWTSFTGIGVQLIDTSRLTVGAVDPALRGSMTARGSLILNIDYAFGEQAEHIIANVLSLFGRNLSSVSVLGKAGGLLGDRGDVFSATGFVEQSGDQYYPVPGVPAVDLERLAGFLPDRGIRQGSALTVTGTLLQNRKMLLFNRHIWGCVGLEMEGSFYLRQILKSMNRGALSKSIDLRFLYYVSDLPLEPRSSLSARMQAVEGVPPLYAITREVLTGILGSGGIPAQEHFGTGVQVD